MGLVIKEMKDLSTVELAAGIETESPKSVCMRADGLEVNSPAAAITIMTNNHKK